jgi:hypothetical protein
MTASTSGKSLSHNGISYTIRVSQRAKYARLKMSPHDGLVVIVPVGFDRKLVAGIVESRREWIDKVQQTFERRRLPVLAGNEGALPAVVDLAGIGESWRISYHADSSSLLAAKETDGGELIISGPVHEQKRCHDMLCLWLKRRAALKLEPQLMRLASVHGFKVSNVSVRKQRSRWGSCSSRGTVSLNINLIFLPPLLVRYILIHELCHTLHMNHSARYWSEVARYDPDYIEHDREMLHAWRFIPAWAAAR